MRTLLTAAEIEAGVARLAEQINADLAPGPLLLVGLLDGCILFLADLMRKLRLPVTLMTIRVSSYRGTATSPGELVIELPDQARFSGKNVLIVDDIFDTGRTVETLIGRLKDGGAHSVRSVVLLWKKERNQVDTTPDYYAFEIPDVFVVGYGLDYNGEYRELPEIAVVALADG